MDKTLSTWRFWPGNRPSGMNGSLVVSHDAGLLISGKNWFQAREEYRRLRHSDPTAWEMVS